MRSFLITLFTCCAVQIALSQTAKSTIITSDIPNFWAAYDQLAHCKTRADSVAAFQNLYFDKASEGLKLFVKARNLNAETCASLARAVPKFWNSLRPNTLKLQEYSREIDAIFDQYEAAYPKFKRPKVCLAIGRLSTGGTVKKDWLLIGSEIASADRTIDKSELNPWLRSVMLPEDQVLELVAHETVHAQQKMKFGTIWGYLTHRLLTTSIREGSADFVAKQVAGITINKNIHAYGEMHEAELWAEFSKVMLGNDFSQWLYNGNNSKERPADLGYFIGYKICESYYEQASNKDQALKEIIEVGNVKRFLKKSKYAEKFDH